MRLVCDDPAFVSRLRPPASYRSASRYRLHGAWRVRDRFSCFIADIRNRLHSSPKEEDDTDTALKATLAGAFPLGVRMFEIPDAFWFFILARGSPGSSERRWSSGDRGIGAEAE